MATHHTTDYQPPGHRRSGAASTPHAVSALRVVVPVSVDGEGHEPPQDIISIRPTVGMYRAFARLNYKPWYALAEFVDNAVQSFLDNRSRLSHVRGEDAVLRVAIAIEDDWIHIRDNAAGIRGSDFARAFCPADVPADRSGLSEHGMGLKAAATWFGTKWSVRTSALGENIQRTITFDVDDIVAHGKEVLPIRSVPAKPESSYTVVSIKRLTNRPHGRTVTKIRRHLANIYRRFIEDGSLVLTFVAGGQKEVLSYDPCELLAAPSAHNPTMPSVVWRKEIGFRLKDGRKVTGWAGLRKKGSVSEAGLSIFRRGRLIQGSGDQTYRPAEIFGSKNKYTYQRLVGELDFEGFAVSHTKDGIHWQGGEEEFLDLLADALRDGDMDLLKQAREYRVRTKKKAKDLPSDFGKGAVSSVVGQLSDRAGPVIEGQLADAPADLPVETQLDAATQFFARKPTELRLERAGRTWRVTVELARDPALDFFSFCKRGICGSGDEEHVTIRLNLAHPFSEAHINGNECCLEPLLRIVTSMALGELTARESGVRQAGAVRRNFNEILSDVLSVERNA